MVSIHTHMYTHIDMHRHIVSIHTHTYIHIDMHKHIVSTDTNPTHSSFHKVVAILFKISHMCAQGHAHIYTQVSSPGGYHPPWKGI
jgi:hypothetical protein